MDNMKLDSSIRLAPTNLSGIFTKVRTAKDTAEQMNISPLISSGLLRELQDVQTPAVQKFREKILSRQWRPEDQIIPLLKPQIDVTHQLTGRAATGNVSFTSGNWAGATIKGAWKAALGIWRVPTVGKPTTPPSTSGGWNSSSWVGIDGTYGSNDVLQAGVQQQVSSNGAASYVAWFEWFAPQQPTSPPYIFQTNIENIQIQPGDEVFCGVYYVDRQGEIIFGNVDRGHYFSMVLAPPPGASFSGNSAEWIMEAPNTGEPGTSLPSFTPVVFSSAFSTDQVNKSGDPANADTTNIVRFGAKLTSVSLRTNALDIDYIGSGVTSWNADWFPLPSKAVFDHTKQQVAAVSRAPGNLDLFVIGFDNHVWSTFWTQAGGWNADWFPLPGKAVFDRDKQQISAVSRAPGNLDLFVIGFDNHVWSTFWNQTGGWNHDWFPLPGAAVFDHTTQHIAAVSRAPGNLDLFVIGFDNHGWSTFWNQAGGWNHDWFPLPGAAVFDHTTQHIAAVSRAPGNLDLFVIGFNNHVWSTFWSQAGGWSHDWFQIPGAAVFDHTTQQIAAVSRTPGNLDLFVIGFDNHVWSAFWSQAGGWSHDWFPLPGAAVFDHTTQQVAAVSRTAGNLDLFVLGFDNRGWTAFWSANGGWSSDWTPLPGRSVFAHTTQRVAAVSRAPGNLDLFVIGFDNHIWSTFGRPPA